MKNTNHDYERVVEQLIQDPKSYDSWETEPDLEEEIRSEFKELIWGEE